MVSEIDKLDYVVNREGREFDNYFINRAPALNPAISGFNFIFFTSPDLPLTSTPFNAVASNYSTSDALNKNGKFLKLPGYGDSIYSPDIVSMLSGEKNVFMPLFGNRSISAPGSNQELNTIDYAETWNGYKIVLGTTTKGTRIAGTFNMDFLEDANLTMSKSLCLWIDTIEGQYFGDVISARSMAADFSSVQNSYIDNVVSMYHFATRPDGKTLEYWSKYTGVIPLTKPFDVFQSNDAAPTIIDKITANFAFSYKEDMEIAILREFNSLMNNAASITSETGVGSGNYYFENSVDIGSIGASGIGITKNGKSGLNMPVYELHLVENNNPMYDGYSYTNFTNN